MDRGSIPFVWGICPIIGQVPGIFGLRAAYTCADWPLRLKPPYVLISAACSQSEFSFYLVAECDIIKLRCVVSPMFLHVYLCGGGVCVHVWVSHLGLGSQGYSLPEAEK